MEADLSLLEATAPRWPEAWATLPRIDAALLVFQGALFRRQLGPRHKISGLPGYSIRATQQSSTVTVGEFGFGAPVAVILLEKLARANVERLIAVGTAGCLGPGLRSGDLIVCRAARHEDGVSSLYLPTRPELSEADGGLTEALSQEVPDAVCGVSWTTDAPYRETLAKLQTNLAAGAVCVEMEAAALFAVGRLLDVQVAGIFVVTDGLLETGWRAPDNNDAVQRSLDRAYASALNVLERP